MTHWSDLTQELDAWAADGRRATLWWRDDDAAEPDAALERLLALAVTHDLPLALAVIPARATKALAQRLAEAEGVTLLQHGYAHRNHAPAGEKKVELGPERLAVEVLEELAHGRILMTELFGPGWFPVLVPPWNRIADNLTPALTGLGYSGLSAYGPRRAVQAAPGLTQINCHADIMRWAAPRGFVGEAEALDLLTGHLGARRAERADVGEPTGLLTHHLAHDAACWAFLDALIARLTDHPAVRFVAAAEAFGTAEVNPAARGAA
ncbi:MAG: polysaccharide deacetylase family protein [Alphaproteobacteria bacterium]